MSEINVHISVKNNVHQKIMALGESRKKIIRSFSREQKMENLQQRKCNIIVQYM